ncbi:MAG: transglutaminase domain-containing protein [Bacilli bacterium]|nr:transglutaminase domain-containing protein [Bacilli bacterium]
MKKGRIFLYFFLVLVITLFNFYFRPVESNPKLTDDYRNSNSFVNNLYVSDEIFKKALLKTEDYYFYESVLKGISEGKDSITIKCDESDNCSSLLQPTVEAIMLDHPELLNFQVMATGTQKDGYFIYNNISTLGPIQYKLGTLRIERIINNIRKDTKNMSDQEKIIYVYNYVASHDYDYAFTFTGSNQSAYSFFTKKSSVCAGFAKSSQLIFQNIGISSYLVTGYDHMWNYVEYEGKYYVFDATVGASHYDKSISRYYDGLGETTVGEIVGNYSELYPKIEKEKLRDIFEL